MASLGVLSSQLYRSKKGPKSFFSLYFASAADKRVTLSIKLRRFVSDQYTQLLIIECNSHVHRDDDKFKINLLESQSCPSLVDPRP
jgi:hypothetical protein